MGGEVAVEQIEKDLGLQIRGLRKSQGLTQQQLADRANTSLGAVKNLEAGHGATTRTLARVLRALQAEAWIGTLFAPQPTFNPLDLPGVRKSRARRSGASKPSARKSGTPTSGARGATAKNGFRAETRYERGA